TVWSLNCSAILRAAFVLRANSITPDTGRSNRWGMPRYTLPGLLYLSFRYALTIASRVGIPGGTPCVKSGAGFATAKQWLSSYRTARESDMRLQNEIAD